MSNLPSEINLSRISQANIVGFSRLYCSIFETTAGVATLGLLPPISPGGLRVPEKRIQPYTYVEILDVSCKIASK